MNILMNFFSIWFLIQIILLPLLGLLDGGVLNTHLHTVQYALGS